MGKFTILVADDDELIRAAIAEFLTLKGYEVLPARNLKECAEMLAGRTADAAIVDYFLPDGNALDLLRRIREEDSFLPVLVLTGHGSIDLAVLAIKEGAEQFLTKPIQLEVLGKLLDSVLLSQRNRRKQLVRKATNARGVRDPFLGSSRTIRELADAVHRIVGTNRPILIEGETGTGKSVLASWLHDNGPRSDESLVDLNCAGLSRELLDSELFGHEKGAFTGAISRKLGLLEVAHRGTVFLDEIGDLDGSIQPKLLKVLEDNRLRRLGEIQDRSVDLHLLAATHRNLKALVAEGKFRSDLYFRISTIELRMPALRERSEDIPLLANNFMRQLEAEMGRARLEISQPAMERMQSYAWPGNIRELRNVLERAALLCNDSIIEPANLAFQLPPTPTRARPKATLSDCEREHIEKILDEESGKVDAAAVRLGIPRSSLYAKIREHRLRRPSLNPRPPGAD